MQKVNTKNIYTEDTLNKNTNVWNLSMTDLQQKDTSVHLILLNESLNLFYFFIYFEQFFTMEY